MADASSDDDRDTLYATFVRGLRARFADRAIAVAEAQAKLADGDALQTWSSVISRLRATGHGDGQSGAANPCLPGKPLISRHGGGNSLEQEGHPVANSDTDVEYYLLRLAETERQALTANTNMARLAYAELARLYRDRLRTVRGTPADRSGLASEDEGSDHDG